MAVVKYYFDTNRLWHGFPYPTSSYFISYDLYCWQLPIIFLDLTYFISDMSFFSYKITGLW